MLLVCFKCLLAEAKGRMTIGPCGSIKNDIPWTFLFLRRMCYRNVIMIQYYIFQIWTGSAAQKWIISSMTTLKLANKEQSLILNVFYSMDSSGVTCYSQFGVLQAQTAYLV